MQDLRNWVKWSLSNGFPNKSNLVKFFSCPISGGKLMRLFSDKSNLVKFFSWQISEGKLIFTCVMRSWYCFTRETLADVESNGAVVTSWLRSHEAWVRISTASYRKFGDFCHSLYNVSVQCSCDRMVLRPVIATRRNASQIRWTCVYMNRSAANKTTTVHNIDPPYTTFSWT